MEKLTMVAANSRFHILQIGKDQGIEANGQACADDHGGAGKPCEAKTSARAMPIPKPRPMRIEDRQEAVPRFLSRGSK
jgi:hypothetical protein